MRAVYVAAGVVLALIMITLVVMVAVERAQT